MNGPLAVTLYLPCFNAAHFLKHVLPAVRAQTYPVERTLVIDDGSTDETAEIARAHGVEVVSQGKNRGLGVARNTAIRLAETPFVASLDADVVPEADWLETLATNMANRRWAGVGGNLVETVQNTVADRWRAAHMQQGWGQEPVENPPFLCGNGTLYRKADLEAVGLFDESCRSNGEDGRIGNLLRSAGFEILYDPAAVCHHLREDTLESICQSFWNYHFHDHVADNPVQARKRRHFALRKLVVKNTFQDLLAGRVDVAALNLVMFSRWRRFDHALRRDGVPF